MWDTVGIQGKDNIINFPELLIRGLEGLLVGKDTLATRVLEDEFWSRFRPNRCTSQVAELKVWASIEDNCLQIVLCTINDHRRYKIY